MIERLMSIADRNANKAEKAKAWIIIVFLLSPASAGYWVIWRWIAWQVTPRHEGLFNLTESGLHVMTTVSIGFLIISAALAISALYARREYRESTYLNQLEKGYHEPIMSHHEPINTQAIDTEVRDVKIRMDRNGQTIYMPLAMTAEQAIEYYDRQPLNANELRQLIEEYKGWDKLTHYLSNRRIRANTEALYQIPERVEYGQAVTWNG